MGLANLWLIIALLAVAAPLAAVLVALRAKTRGEPQNEVDNRKPKPKKAARRGKQDRQPRQPIV
jgi:hypothetical protein